VASASKIKRELIRPISKDLAYALLYDVYTLISAMRSFTISGRDPSKNEVSVVWSERRLIVGGSRVSFKIRSEVVSDDTISMYFDSDVFKARINYRLVPVFYALHIIVDGACEGGRTDLCMRVLSEFLRELDEALKKPLQPMVKPPPPTRPAQPAPSTPPALSKPATPSQPVGAPTVQVQQKEVMQPVRPPARQEAETIDVNKLFDEVSIAMILMNSELITMEELAPPWSISTLLGKAREKKGVLAQYKLGLISIKDAEGATDLVVFINKNGEPLGFYGHIDGNVVKGSAVSSKYLKRLYPLGRQYIGYGVRECCQQLEY